MIGLLGIPAGLSGRLVAVATVLLLTTCAPAVADWLVLKTGESLETRGAWTVEGEFVLFTTSRGAFSSLQLDEVDLEASRGRSTPPEAKAQSAPAATPSRSPVLRLVDGDLRRFEAAALSPAEAAAARGRQVRSSNDLEMRPALQMDTSRLVVTDWRVADSESGNVSIAGAVENQSGAFTAGIVVSVTLFGEDDREVMTSQATLSAAALAPRGRALFAAGFPGVYSFSRLAFEVEAAELEAQPATDLDAAGATEIVEGSPEVTP